MRLNLVGGELNQVESNVGANPVGANSPWGETGSYLIQICIKVIRIFNMQPVKTPHFKSLLTR